MIRTTLIAMLVALSPQLAAWAAPFYSVTDLGTLGGATSFGTALNDNGHAVGYSLTAGGDTRAFYWTLGGGMVDLGIIGTGSSQAFDISNTDNIVGQSGGKAFRWAPGPGMVLIDSASNGSANGINESNVAIGSRAAGGQFNQTLRWSAANLVTNPFPLFNSRGYAINDLAQFVGTVSTLSGGYYSNGSTVTNLGFFLPEDLNNSRTIVGSVSGIATWLDFDTNTTTTLGKLSPTDSSSTALGINQAGTIVGISVGSGAFVTDSPSTIVSLTSLLAPSFSGWEILTATDINNAGQIIGVGRYGGQDHAVILNLIVPEPNTLSLLFAALGTMALFAQRKIFCSRGL